MRVLIPVFALVVAGCTRIAVDEPMGRPIAPNELEEFAGEWIGDKEVVFTVSTNENPGGFTATWMEDGESKSASCVFTMIGKDDVSLIWVKEDELDAYLVFRVAAGHDSLTLLHPDEEEIEELVASGELKGLQDEDERAWILSVEGLEDHLVGKELWNLAQAIPFLRKQRTSQESPPGNESESEE